MSSLRALQVLGLAALAVGVVVAFFTHRAPKRGWIGVVLLLVASGAWALIESVDSSRPTNLSMFVAFLFVAPIAIVYAFRVRRGPDRIFALAAFVGSFVLSAFLLFAVAGIIYSFTLGVG